MKKRDNITILLFCLLTALCTNAANAKTRLDSLLLQLDETIREEHLYTDLKKTHIEAIKSQLNLPHPTEEKQYAIYRKLSVEYESFICDSALKYDYKSLAAARASHNESWITDSQIHLSETLAQASLFSRATEALGSIKRENMSAGQLIAYYKAYISVYTFWTEFYSDTYIERDGYIDSLLQIITPEHTFEYASFRGLILIGRGELEQAEQLLTPYFSGISPQTKDYAVYTARLAHLYNQKGDMEKQKEFLAMSAICDIKITLKENLSLSILATLLYNEGDVNRANLYIKKSMEDANFYNGKLRSLQIAKVLPMIDKVYQAERNILQHKLALLLAIVSILSVILLTSIAFIFSKNKHLNELNESLQTANERQIQTNINLMEANHIKEQFIHNFLELCTTYITQLNSFKLTVKRKIVAGQISDILKLTASDNEYELKELYKNFDKAFLQIYPQFVSEINKLLRKEEQYQVNANFKLNQELRIFALIRLGITDTNQIAAFLHYSLRTVYNYRSKVRSKALRPEEDLEEMIKKIGKPDVR
ncbi:MAG: DUF6377 domain-containing protein [Tannerellaceae bacterium]|nr:DUF6377 domain-containing protein [Tannerellaceae bacterium]